MNINFEHYVQYRGRQFEKIFHGKKNIIYIFDSKEWLRIFPGDKEKINRSSGLSNSSGYVWIDPELDMIDTIDEVILHELTHIFKPKLTERQVEQFVKRMLSN